MVLRGTPGAASYDVVALWRADLGIARQLATYYRPGRAGYGVDPPRLRRRALGGGVGLLISDGSRPWRARRLLARAPDRPRDRRALGEAVPLGRKDLADTQLERCTPGQDGWLLDTSLEGSPSFDRRRQLSSVDGAEFRLRLDPGALRRGDGGEAAGRLLEGTREAERCWRQRDPARCDRARDGPEVAVALRAEGRRQMIR